MKVKCWRGNYDGRSYGLICAKSQKEAAAIIGTSVGDLKKFWGQIDPIEPALSNPGVLFIRSSAFKSDEQDWKPRDRTTSHTRGEA